MMTIIESFITPGNANSIISKADTFFKKATLLGRQLENYRTAESSHLPKHAGEVAGIVEMLALKTNLPIDNQESPQIIRYTQGGEYKEHYDFFHPGESYYQKQVVRGGQRLKTCLIYLNDDFEGGETMFHVNEIVVKPETGKLIIWDNVNADGSLNYDSLHSGLPVKSGVKYIMVTWIREGKFI